MDTTNEKPKKLGLKLKASVDATDLAKKYIDLQSKPSAKPSFSASGGVVFEDLNNTRGLSVNEVNKKLDLVKRAAQEKEHKEAQLALKAAQIAEEALLKSALASRDEQVNLSESVTLQEKILPEAPPPPRPDISHIKQEDPAAVKKVAKDFEEKPAPVAKAKDEQPRKLKKQDIYTLLDDEAAGRINKFARRRSNKKSKFEQKPDKLTRDVEVYGEISVADLASKMSERAVDLVKELMKLGIMADGNKIIDIDTAELLTSTFGHNFKHMKEVTVESILSDKVDREDSLVPRPPIVTIMGHVDHGKTSLLDAIRSTDIALKEFGGITQNIGAYQVSLQNGRKITFIDTPGHEAFSLMRSRGAQVTDIVVLVVAADDGIKDQTVEAINHAKAAKLPIIVAVNKIDKVDDADYAVNKIKTELLNYDLVAEDMGGDIIFMPVSALKKINLDKLEETILLVADFIETKGNYSDDASGVVLDAKLDKHRGSSTSILVTRGTLKVGQFIVAGSTYGKIKRIQDDKGRSLEIAEPSSAVSILGLEDVAAAGDKFTVMQDEKLAKEVAENYSKIFKNRQLNLLSPVQNMLDPFSKGKQKELLVLIKADSQGSLEAIIGSLSKIVHPEVLLRILHSAVGGVNESDVSLASASRALILAFNVRPSSHAELSAKKEGVGINCYAIIYDLINDVKSLLSGMLAPNIREVWLGNVEIREVFNITKVGKVAGCYVLKGIAKRGANMRLLRNDVVIHEGKLKTLRRFKEDVKEVRESYECGIVFEDYQDIQLSDKVEIFEYIEEKQKDI